MNLKAEQIIRFQQYLMEAEKSPATVEKYTRDVKRMYRFMKKNEDRLDRVSVLNFKQELVREYKAASVNSMLAAINQFLEFIGESELKVKKLKIQKKPYREAEKELSRNEYMQLVRTAEQKGDQRLSLLMQTVCATGIRISEVVYITVEALRKGETEVSVKGKTRVILIPGKLQKLLQRYQKKQKIISGQLFRTRNGTPVNRSNIWRDMKKLCRSAGVNPEKVFPHNLRHLFARTFYQLKKDLVKLADLLGHSNIETTRIYTKSSGLEHRKEMNALGLVMPMRT